jgi:hypothetical protein
MKQRLAVRIRTLVALSGALAALSGAVHGQVANEGAIRFRVGAGYTDNVLREPADGEEASYTAVGTVLAFDHVSRRVTASVLGDVEHRSYSESGIDNELYGDLDASLELAAVIDRFIWVFNNSYGQTRRDPFRIDSPINREYINVLSTGPLLMVPVGGRMSLQVSLIGAKRSYEDSSVFDGTSTTAQASLQRALSTRSSLSLTLVDRTTDYDRIPIRESTVQNAYVAYQSELASGAALVAAGVTRVDSESGSDTAPYVDISWARDVGARSHLTLSAGSEYVDPAQDFASSRAGGFIPDRIGDILPSADVYRRSDASIAHVTRYDRLTFEMGASFARQRYESDTRFGNDERRFNVSISRQLSTSSALGIGARVAKREFDETGQEDEDKTARLWWNKRLARRFFIEIAYQRDQRDSVIGVGYDENSVRLFFEVDARPARAL